MEMEIEEHCLPVPDDARGETIGPPDDVAAGKTCSYFYGDDAGARTRAGVAEEDPPVAARVAAGGGERPVSSPPPSSSGGGKGGRRAGGGARGRRSGTPAAGAARGSDGAAPRPDDARCRAPRGAPLPRAERRRGRQPRGRPPSHRSGATRPGGGGSAVAAPAVETPAAAVHDWNWTTGPRAEQTSASLRTGLQSMAVECNHCHGM